MSKTLFIFSASPKGKILLVKRTLLIPEFGIIYKNVGILLGVMSDCEELVGGQPQKMMGLKHLAEMTSEELSGIINR